jgi:hypothetical protein
LEEYDVKRHLIRSILVFGLVVGVLGMAATAYGQNAGLGVEASGPVAKPRFYGFSFDFTMADQTGLNAVGQNYRNDLAFYFEPTWNFGRMYLSKTPFKNMHLAARFIVTQNLAGVDESNFTGNINAAGPQGTCSNILPSANGGVVDPTMVQYCNPVGADRRTDYGDLWLTLRAPGVYKIPKIEVAINPSIRFIAPTSVQSRFSGLQTAITGFLGLGRSFWKSRIRLGYSLGFTKNFHSQTTTAYKGGNTTAEGATTQGGNPYDGISSGLSNFYSDPTRTGPLGGPNTNFTVMNIISGGVQFHEKVSFDLLYFTINGFAYDQTCQVQVNGVTEDICANGNAVAAASGSTLNRPGKRDSQVLWASLNYSPLDWLTLTLAWINFAPMQNPNSTYRQGIFSADYNSFSSLSLGATVSLDTFAAKYIKEKKN